MSNSQRDVEAAFAQCPLIAILRGITPQDALAVGEVLVEAGFTMIEVPLNSPDAFASIKILAAGLAGKAVVGAGTLMVPADAARLAELGAHLAVMPHFDPALVAAAKAAGLWCAPGVATPSEGFAALAAGADALKLFPAEAMPPAVIRAWRAVFPQATRFLPVGGIDVSNIPAYRAAGASGFGIGSTLFKPGKPVSDIARDARALMAAMPQPALGTARATR